MFSQTGSEHSASCRVNKTTGITLLGHQGTKGDTLLTHRESKISSPMKYFTKHLPGEKEVFISAHSFRGFSPESLGLVWWEHHLTVTRDFLMFP